MYESYFGLREKAFRKTPDPRYLFLNETYEEALEQIAYAVDEMEIALLTGEVGSGKTLLSRALVDRLGDGHEVGMILNPRLSPRQFLAATAGELGVASPRFHSNELHEQIHDRLLALRDEGRAALLIVDEAHLIPSRATFEEIRLLTNFQLDDENLISIVLVGQPELRTRLRHSRYRALTQRIGASFHLSPLREEDAPAYIAHRLRVAGRSEGPALFTPEAARLLHRAAGGIPRVLNHVATQALLEAMARGRETVDAETARAAVAGQPFLVPGEPSDARGDETSLPKRESPEGLGTEAMSRES